MKKFSVTVNGNTYHVEIEELGDSAAVAPAIPAPAAPVSAPVVATPVPAAAQPTPIAPAAVVSAGETPITAPMPGKVTKVAVKEGTTVKKGDVILILEAMKMQNEISAPIDGTVKSINVNVGQSVKPGQVMAVIS
jgi:glutaconyl-CoA decarboxylase